MLMTRTDLTGTQWDSTVERLGGAAALERGARATRAFVKPREVRCAVDLLRLVLAYCLGGMGLRLTAAWAEGIGLAQLSNVALLGRLRNAVPWLERIVAPLLVDASASGAPASTSAHGGRPRLIRLMDATTVRKAGVAARARGKLWRVHAVLDVSGEAGKERFSAFEFTDEKGAEAIDRVAVIACEIRVADRVHCRVEGLATVIAAGADVVVRASWQSARWQDEGGCKVDIIRELSTNLTGCIDRPIELGRDKAAALPLRLIAVRMPKAEAVKAVAEARAKSRSKQCEIQPGTLIAAEWVIIVTSLASTQYSTGRVLEIYRLRWRIEIAFKRLKSVVGLAGPPGHCALVAKAWSPRPGCSAI